MRIGNAYKNQNKMSAENKTQLSFTDIAVRQDEIVQSVIGQKGLIGFQKAYTVAQGIKQLKQLLTNEYMAPIMELQGTKLGFRTDKDKTGGYPLEVVKNCLIEAVFYGLQPYNNQFNIIAGNMYPTKEGLEYKLNGWEGLKYTIVLGIPNIGASKTSAVISPTIKWKIGNEPECVEIINIPLKMDSYTSVDALQGKAKRKACAWLVSQITGESTFDGDVDDIPFTVVDEKTTVSPEKFDQLKSGVELKTMTVEQAAMKFELDENQINELKSIENAKN